LKGFPALNLLSSDLMISIKNPSDTHKTIKDIKLVRG